MNILCVNLLCFLGTANQVSEAECCRIATSICEELEPDDHTVQSSALLTSMKRLDSTGHTPRLFAEFEAAGLTAKITNGYVWIDWNHPVLPFQNIVKCLSESGKLELLLGADPALRRFKLFWDDYRKISPRHDVFETHHAHLHQVIPLLIHADEGTGQKKRPCMVLQVQGLMGAGTSRGESDLNYIGSSIKTRFLYTVIGGNKYANKKAYRLKKLVSALADDLKGLFYNGVAVSWHGRKVHLYFAFLGMKGDWPALVKIGQLDRHHLKDGQQQTGVCHLCRAGMPNYPWHVTSVAQMDRSHQDSPFPWKQPSPLLQVPQDFSNPAAAYHIDVFHTFHKGLIGDLCANGIATQLLMTFQVFHFLV